METQTEQILKGFNKDIQKRLKKGTLKFIGFCSEKAIKLNKNKGYIFIITQNKDVLSEVFGTQKQNVYVYKEVLKNE